MRLSIAVQNGQLDTLIDRIDVTGPGKVEFWSGSPPAEVTDSPAGTLLVAFVANNPAFGAAGAVTDGLATADLTGIGPEDGLATGIVGFARVYDGDNVPLWDNNDVSDDAMSEAQFILSSLNISVGVPVSLESWSVSLPASSS